MPLVTLPWSGQSMYAPDRGEYMDMMRTAVREEAKQRARDRAKKRMELTIPVNPAASSVFIGQATGNNTANGPEEGYIWSVKLVSVTLAASGTANIFKASVSGDTRRPLAPTTPVAGTIEVFQWSADQCRVRHGEGLYIVGSQNIVGVYLAAWEVPSEMEAEVYD